MKKILPLIAAGLCAAAMNAMPTDTTLLLNNKRIEITESNNRMKVKVFEITEHNDTTEQVLLFEGHYKDGRSYEQRKYFRSVNIPVPTWRRRGFDGHWAGFGMGFINFTDQKRSQINDIDGITLRSGSSLEYNFNILEQRYLLSHNSSWAAVTGIGLKWSRYRIDANQYIVETEGITSLHPAPEGIVYSSSRLNLTHLTIPLLLEWQNRRKGSIPIFISAGAVGVIKTISSSKVTYKDETGRNKTAKMDSGMNLRPVSVQLLLQAGLDNLGVYVGYSPITLFESGKGPKLYPVSIGLQLHW
ncbi:MAG: PorT family protein [Tannerellaceae bacterium]|jgi:hypothetical protein|nr:PorT family protein [Tannerellaceae bacterium]